MYPTTDDPIQDAIAHLQTVESDTNDKVDELDNFITEVTEVKERLEEHGDAIKEVVTQLEDIASLVAEAEEASNDADNYLR